MKNKNTNAVEYKMSKKMFDALVKTRATEEDKKMNPYSYVMRVINETFGIKGTVTHIIVG